MSISANNKTRACQWLPGKIFYLSPLTLSVSLLAGGPRLRPDPSSSSDYSYSSLQESKTMRRNPGHSNPLSQHWDHIITTSITRRTVRPWLVMMMTSRARVQWHGRTSSLSLSPTLQSSHGQPLSNSSETLQREGHEPDAKQKMRVSNPLHQRGR